MESMIWFVYSGQLYSAIKTQMDLSEIQLRLLFAVHYMHEPATANRITLMVSTSKNQGEKRAMVRDVLSSLLQQGLLATADGQGTALIYFVTPKGFEAIAEVARICQSTIPLMYQKFST